MQRFVFKPSVELLVGLKVTKDTELDYERDGIKQTLRDLVLRSIVTTKGEGYDSVTESKVYLEEGDILVFEEEGRGYIKPLGNTVVTIEEAIADLENIKDLG
jgi:hypothetical protein